MVILQYIVESVLLDAGFIEMKVSIGLGLGLYNLTQEIPDL